MISDTYIKMAEKEDKILVCWNDLNREEKKEIMNNFESYLIVF